MNNLENRIISLSVEEEFHAMHSVPVDPGVCSRPHGHSWTVIVDITGIYHPKQGMLVNFRDVKSIIRRFDHDNVNKYLRIPTAENIARYIAMKVMRLNPSSIISVRVTVYETEKNRAYYMLKNWRYV